MFTVRQDCIITQKERAGGLFPYFEYYEYAAMNTAVQTSVRIPAFNSFGYTPRSGVAGSYKRDPTEIPRFFHQVRMQ